MRTITDGLRWIHFGAYASIAVAIALCSAAPALAAPTVFTTADSGAGSLRQAIIDASPTDTIIVPAGLYTLTSGALAVNKTLTLAGAGQASTTISGGGTSGVVAATGGVALTLSGLTVRDGSVVVPSGLAKGAGVSVTGGGTLTLDHVALTGNTVDASATAANAAGGTASGAGIFADGATLTLRSSSVSGNFSTSTGNGTGSGGTAEGGVILSEGGAVSLIDTSVDDNIANLLGGATGGGGSHGGTAQGGVVNVQGAGADGLSMDGSSMSRNHVIAHGRGTSSGGLAQGGIIATGGPENVTISRSKLDGNEVDLDGGSSGGLAQGAVLSCQGTAAAKASITDSTIIDGRVTARGAASGAGGLVQGGVVLCSGNLAITGSTVSDTRIDADGGAAGVGGLVQGGVLNYSGSGSTLAITGSTVRNTNVTARGNGASLGGVVQATGITAFSNAGITLSNSRLEGNVGDASGGATAGGGSGQGGAAALSVSGSAALSIISTTVSDNTLVAAAGSTGSGTGGSVQAAGLSLGVGGASASAALTNVTVSGNAVSAPGGGANGTGGTANAGGLYIVGAATTTIVGSTLAGNSASATPGGSGAAGTAVGGNLYHTSNGVQLRDTIIAGGIGDTGEGNCDAPVISQGHNLESADQCGLTGAGDLVGKDPLLKALADNGGQTQTRALSTGSPAIDAGGTATFPDPLGCPATDQRGLARPKGAACDIGAYEAAPGSAVTGQASAVTATSATLGGSATNPDIVAGSASFDYGLTDAYGLSSVPQPVASGTSAGPVSAGISGLQPGRTYHFRAVATNTAGAAVGTDQTFVTAVAPPTPTPSPTPSGDRTAPVLTNVAASRTSFKINRKGQREKAVASRTKRGTTIRFRLSEAARVVVRIERVGRGRKVGKRCMKPSPSNRRKRSCKRYTRPARFAMASAMGNTAKTFSGRIGRRTLKPGRYRATLIATDAAKNRSKPRSLALRVLRG